MVENLTSSWYPLLKQGILYLRHWRMSAQIKCERLKHLWFDGIWIKPMKYELVQTAAQNPINLKFISTSSQVQFSATVFLLLRHLGGSKGRWSGTEDFWGSN